MSNGQWTMQKVGQWEVIALRGGQSPDEVVGVSHAWESRNVVLAVVNL